MVPANKLVSVRFLRTWPPYNAEELAGFLPHKAKILIKSRVAELVSLDRAEEVEAAEPPKDTHPSLDRGTRRSAR